MSVLLERVREAAWERILSPNEENSTKLRKLADKLGDREIKKNLDDDIILLSLLDQKYFNQLYAPATDVEAPHVYFARFITPDKKCSNDYELYYHLKDKEASMFLQARAKKCFEIEGSPAG